MNIILLYTLRIQKMIRDRLKVLTKPFHDELEVNSFGKKIFEKSISKEEFCDFLNRFYAILAPIEEAFVAHKDEFAKYGLNVDERLKCHIIKSDLESLGCTPTNKRVASVELNNFSALVSAMYVFEGSTMGGMMISKELQACGIPFGYFLPYGERTMPMWQGFIKFLEGAEQSGELDENMVIISACSLFLNLGSEMKR